MPPESGHWNMAIAAAVAAMAIAASRPTPGGTDAAAAVVDWPRAAIPPRDSIAAQATEARADALLAGMTLEQKIGQMIQAEIKSASPADVKTYHLGSILNGGGSFPGGKLHASVSDWLELADRYYAASMEVPDGLPAIPVIWGTDAVHGHNNVFGAVLFPHNIGLGAANDAALTEAIGAAVASEVRSTGIDWVFAPTLAVVGDLRWGRSYEGFADDPALVRRLGSAYVRGLQGAANVADGVDAQHVIATAKHFIGDGGTTDGIDQGDTASTEAELRDRHAQGYYGAFEADAQAVMVSFSSWQGNKLHGHRYLLTDVLRQRMGFDGLVVSDWNGIGQVPGCSNTSCPIAINAGIDLIMAPEDWKSVYANTLDQARSGAIPMTRIDDAVRRILRVKLRAGLFDGEPPSRQDGQPRVSTVGSAAHRALARRAVRQSLVLLKNRNQILPLDAGQTVLVAGSAADSLAKQAGGWSLTWQGDNTSNADFPNATSIFQGIAEAVRAGGGAARLSVDGSFESRPDVAIVVFGEEPYAEGRGDLRDLGWSTRNPADLALIRKLKAAGVPVVSVFVSGRPLWTNPEINASDAFIAAWLPGTEGAGIADLLFRAAPGAMVHDFVGRLPFAWPASAAPAGNSSADPAGAAFPAGYGLSLRDAVAEARPLPETSGLGAASRRSETVLYDRRAVSPWRVFLGDEKGWQMPLTTARSVSASGILTVSEADHLVQGDALRAVWNGKGQAQLYLQAGGGTDWTELLKTPRQLAFSIKVNGRPTAITHFRQDCIYPCGAKADITRLLNVVPLSQWVRVSIDEQCLVMSGLDPRKVETPFLIHTTGKLDLSVSYIALEAIGTNPPTVGCSR